MSVFLRTAGLLVLSNLFMTFADAICLVGAVYFVFRGGPATA